MPPASDFARRAVVLADAIVRVARDTTRAVDERTVTETLTHANELDDSDPRFAARIEHAHHRAAISIIDAAREACVLVTRRGAESVSDFNAEPGEFSSFDAAWLTRTLSHALTCAETRGSASACYGTIEVVMESCTIDEAADVVAWMEANRERLRGEETWKKGKLTTLRTLIALCKRCVGRSTREARTRGRAMMLQSWLMDVTDRSGLNVGGQSNPNVTPIFEQEEWTREDVNQSCEDGEMEVDGESEATSSTHGIDAEFHKTFWSLQLYFQNPTKTMCKNGAWNSFYASLRVVLDKFEEHPLSEAAKTLELSPDSEIYQLIGQRYLTARRLLPLQMRDYMFRRQILIQIALFLEAMTTEKFKEHVVEEEITDGQQRVMELLKRTGPNAHTVTEFIEECLEDEAGWRKWRDEGYPSFVREPIDFEKEPMPDNWDIKYSQWPPDQFPPDDPRFKEDYGDENLNKVMNVSDEDVMNANMSAAYPSTTLEEFFRPCLEEMDPENQIEEKYKKINDEVFRWQAMRMLSQSHLHLFEKIAVEGLESVVPEILGVPDPRPPKSAGEEGKKVVEIDYTQDPLTLLSSHIEGFDSDLESLSGEENAKADVAKEEIADDEMVVGEEAEEVAAKAEQKHDIKVEENVEAKKETQTATEVPEKRLPPESESKAPANASNAAPRGGQGRGRGRRAEGQQGQQGRGRQQVKAVRPPQRQQQPAPSQRPQQPPPQRRREPSREPQRREPPPQRDQPRPQQQRQPYTPPYPQPRGLTQWDRGGRDQVRDEPPRRDAAPPARQQGSNLGKRGRDDDGPQGGGQRARGNQGQRYNRGPNRRR